MRAEEYREQHRVDVRYGTFAPVAFCSCGWIFRPPADREPNVARADAWAAAAEHRGLYTEAKRKAYLKGRPGASL